MRWAIRHVQNADPIDLCYGIEIGMRIALDHPDWARQASDRITNDRVERDEPEVSRGIADRLVAEIQADHVV